MKKGILVLLIGSFALVSSISAQGKNEQPKPQQECPKGQFSDNKLLNLPNLTDAQKSDFKAIKLKFDEESLPIKNRLKEINARQSTILSTTDEVNSELTKLISEESDLKEKFELMKANNLMALKAKLTPEQKVIFNSNIADNCKNKNARKMHKRSEMRGQKGNSNNTSSNKPATKEVTAK